MRRLLFAVVVLASCGGGSSVSSVPPYNDAAVQHVAAAMVANGDLRAPNGGPIDPTDLASLLQIVREACKGPGKVQAMVQTLGANPYLLSMALQLAQTGCPKVVLDAGIRPG